MRHVVFSLSTLQKYWIKYHHTHHDIHYNREINDSLTDFFFFFFANSKIYSRWPKICSATDERLSGFWDFADFRFLKKIIVFSFKKKITSNTLQKVHINSIGICIIDSFKNLIFLLYFLLQYKVSNQLHYWVFLYV